MMLAAMPSNIRQHIYFIRKRYVILDSDLARLYDVQTRILNQSVKRNLKHFPNENFMFQMTREDCTVLRSQRESIKLGHGKHSKYLPLAFTLHGAVLVSSLLRNSRAVEANIAITQAFVDLKQPEEAKLRSGIKPDHFDSDFTVNVLTEIKNLKNNISCSLENITQSLNTLTLKVDALNTRSELQITPVQPAQKLLTNPISTQPISRSHNLTVDHIQSVIAEYFFLTVRELKQTSRKPSIELPRQIAMYLIRKKTQLGLKEIGKHFGNRDHTTVLHACQQIESKLKSDVPLQQTLNTIQAEIG
jgi:hypothetical protein